MTQTPKKKFDMVNFTKDLIYGGLSGSITKTIVAPLERIKIILQIQDSSKQIPKEMRYKGIVDCAVRVYKEQGFLSFWRGNWTNSFVRYFPTQALGFAFDDSFKAMLIKPEVKYSNLEYISRSLLSGGLSGAVSQCFVYPLDFARTRLTADVSEKGKPKMYKGAIDCIVKIVKTEGGIPAIYKGFTISIIGNVFYKGIYFGGYNALKHIFYEDKVQTFWDKWLVSQIVTTTAQYAAYPFDSVRRRLMIRGTGEDALYTTSLQCTKIMWKEEGFKGFFKGALANTFRGIGGALGLVLYDTFKGK